MKRETLDTKIKNLKKEIKVLNEELELIEAMKTKISDEIIEKEKLIHKFTLAIKHHSVAKSKKVKIQDIKEEIKVGDTLIYNQVPIVHNDLQGNLIITPTQKELGEITKTTAVRINELSDLQGLPIHAFKEGDKAKLLVCGETLELSEKPLVVSLKECKTPKAKNLGRRRKKLDKKAS